MNNELDLIAKSSEEIGALRMQHKICGFIRSQILIFEQKIQELNWALDDVNKDKDKTLQDIYDVEIAKIALQTLLKTIEEKL